MRAPRRFVRISLVAVVAVQLACSSYSENDQLDDEAMKVARKLNKDPATAAREWYYPRYIHDYFPGMDQVVVLGDGTVGPNTLNTPVYQLLDKIPAGQATKTNSLSLPQPFPTYGKTCGDPSDKPRTPQEQTACEVLGRNTWMLWVGGNEGFWDWLSRQFGFIDLLRLVNTRERSTRFATAGLINEPGMERASTPDQFGLWLDVPLDPEVRNWREDYLKRAFQTYARKPGYGNGQYGATLPQPSMPGYGADEQYNPKIPPPEIYGLSSGVVGLRLFPNPNFDEDAQKHWQQACGDGAARTGCEAYYGDPAGDPKLIRPFRVGMSCAFCHASYHPLNPPIDRVNPEWTNISGNIGAQYLNPRGAFGNLLSPDNFIYHVLDSQPPGTIDTSLIASDNINNPNTMNSVFNLPQRALVSMHNPREQLVGGSALLPSIWTSPQGGTGVSDPVPDSWKDIFAHAPAARSLADKDRPPIETRDLSAELLNSNNPLRRVPHILVDGADSIGAYGALARVYLNIGTNYEQWNTLHNTVVGFRQQKPFTIDGVRRHSVYWHATQLRVAPLRDYFLKVSPPMPVMHAGSEADRPVIDKDLLPIGRKAFARNCIVCHSSLQPPERHAEMADFATKNNGEFWEHNPGRWLSDPAYLKWAEDAVEVPEFWRYNYLSTDYRIPVNIVSTNPCRAMATNALSGNMWEDYSSQSYRRMPSPGPIPFFNPYMGTSGADSTFVPQHGTSAGAPTSGGGPGFYRVPTLVSIWATAPYLHNNSLGLLTNDPSVKGRLVAFEDGMRKLLWPEQRLESSSYNGATASRLKTDHGLIWRTSEDSYITIFGAYLPPILGSNLPILAEIGRRYPWLSYVSPWVRPLPSLVLLIAAFFVLRRASRLVTRFLGYAIIFVALTVGAALYFFSGGFGTLRIGPIPKGTPVGLLANANPTADPASVKTALTTTVGTLIELRASHATASEVDEAIRTKVAPALMNISKCPDFVMDHGHYFKWFQNMTDRDKKALIELLKTF